MTTRASHKARGMRFETEVTNWLRSRQFKAERLPRTGRMDQGDVAVLLDHQPVDILECKAPGKDGRMNLPDWWRQANTEAVNYARARGLALVEVEPLVIVKARSKPVSQAWVVTTLERFYAE